MSRHSGVAGLDPSSSAVGLAVVGPKGGLRYTASWLRPKDADIMESISSYALWLDHELSHIKATASKIVIEELSVAMNMDSVRKILYMEGISILTSLEHSFEVQQIKATSCRKKVYGAGNLKKMQVYEKNVEKYGDKTFAIHGKAKLDVSDAVALARSG